MNWLHLLKRPLDIPKATRPFFRDYPLRVTAHIANSRCVISDPMRFLYFRIPKAANSTIVATLYKQEHGDVGGKGVKMKGSYRHPDSLDASEARDVRDNYFKFTVVRNPYDRFLSAYLDKIAGDRLRQKSKVTRALKLKPEEPVNIDRFLDYLEFEKGTLGDAHWAIQTDMIFMPLDQLDFIGKVESLSEDLPVIVERIFGNHEFAIEQRASHATGASSKRKTMLNHNQMLRIHRIYEQDFDLLHYPAEL